jgi:two-component system chemotaxis response regulator CheB
MIRLLIVEDSVTQREILRHLFSRDPEITIVGEAATGQDAIELARKLAPDVVLMDIHMPKLDGISATRQIMEQCPVPIVIASATLRRNEIDLAIKALEAGAVAVVEKPQGAVLLHLQKMAPKLRQELLQAAKMTVRLRARGSNPRVAASSVASIGRLPRGGEGVQAIGLVASTGGPSVLRTVISALPSGFPIPILLVQHISRGFEESFASWLSGVTGHRIALAQDGQPLAPGIWMSQQGQHLRVGSGGRIVLTPGDATELHCPSGNALFLSMAEHLGPRGLGVLMTGMGEDGAAGLLALKNAGGLTVIQSAETCLIWGMPRAAREKAAAQLEFSPLEIAQTLIHMAQSATT